MKTPKEQSVERLTRAVTNGSVTLFANNDYWDEAALVGGDMISFPIFTAKSLRSPSPTIAGTQVNLTSSDLWIISRFGKAVDYDGVVNDTLRLIFANEDWYRETT